jgi:tetratricopeptide (TPR) repeat protein
MSKRKTHKAAASLEQYPAVTSALELLPLRWLIPVSVVALTVIFFLPVLQNGFVDWDDGKILLENPYYRGLDWPQLSWMFNTFYMGHYQPLTWISLGLDYLLWGMNPLGYHLTGLLLHAVNALLFYFIALRLLALAFPAAAKREFELRVAALFAALVFAIHPLRVESVAWVTERRDVLSGFFFLSSLLCYLKGAAEAKTDALRRLWMTAAVFVYGLSLFSKAAGVALPIVLLALDVYPVRRLGCGVGGWFGPAARKVWLEKIPFLLLAALFGFIAFAAQREARALLSLETYGVAARLGQALFGIAFYLWKTILPVNLSPIYGLPGQLRPSDWMPFVVSGIMVLAVTTALVIVRRGWPALLAVWICYVALLAPVLGFFQAGPQIAADRYTYLSCLGWAVLAGGALFYFWQRWSHGRESAQIFVPPVLLAGVIVIALGTLTWLQARVWHDSESLWRHAVSAYPDGPRAHNNLGNALVHGGKIAEAIAQYKEAARIDPDYKEAHHNLALTLAERGKAAESIDEYREALRIDPRYKEAHNNLGVALFYWGDSAAAIEHYRAALRIDPAFRDAHNNLAIALVRRGEMAEGIEHYRAALEVDPGYTQARYNLAIALAQLGKVSEAIEQYREALRINPGLQEARNNLDILLEMQGQK